MSIRLMTAVWDLDLPPGEKLVLLALADQANDEGRQCWPSVPTIARRSGQSERTVQRSIISLSEKGHLTQFQRTGTSAQYHVHPRQGVTPDNASPVTKATKTPDKVSPKPSRTTNPQKATPSSGKRAKGKPTLVPDDFVPEAKDGSITAKAMAAWPPGELKSQLEHFRDHHISHATESHDWQASWRTWVKNYPKFNRSARNVRPANDRYELQKPLLRAAVADEHQYGAFESGEGAGASPLWP